MTSDYIPPRPESGEYLAKIIHVQKRKDATVIFYDIAVGASAGWAHQIYIKTSRWPLIQRIDANAGGQVLQILLRSAGVSDIYSAVGMLISINLITTERCAVKRIYPPNHYHLTPDDIKVGTSSWAAGSDDMIRAIYLSVLSGLPVLQCDSRERESPMIEWCAEHEVVLLPSYFSAGDYTAVGSNVIVDRKQCVEELIHNFIGRDNAASYHIAAFRAAAESKQLIYVTGIDGDIHTLDDLPGHQWGMPKLGIVTGDNLAIRLNKYKNLHNNTDFVFCEQSQICETIYNLVAEGRGYPKCQRPA